ncbi:hypothetical protein GCM10010327_34240 [Streptomyces nitrosporeus]|nr:hypothetical protein GCM10010327_34240 [Streptomyces nitrosporeus]
MRPFHVPAAPGPVGPRGIAACPAATALPVTAVAVAAVAVAVAVAHISAQPDEVPAHRVAAVTFTTTPPKVKKK